MWMKGIPIGVIASNASGVIYIDAARKATEWMIRCGNAKLPVLFLQGSPGYMVGKAEEWAASASTVPIWCAPVPVWTPLRLPMSSADHGAPTTACAAGPSNRVCLHQHERPHHRHVR